MPISAPSSFTACDEVLEIFGDRRIGMVIRERAVALAEQPAALNAEALEQLRRDERTGAVAAVVDDFDLALERTDLGDHVVDVPRDDRLIPHAALLVGGLGRLLRQRVEMLNVLAVHRALLERELEPVVLGRIMRAGDLDSADDRQMMQRPVVERGRYDADVDHVDARCGQAVDQCVTQRRSAGAIVAPDGDRAADSVLGHVRRVCDADRARGLGGQILVDDAADVILAKNAGGDSHRMRLGGKGRQ